MGCEESLIFEKSLCCCPTVIILSIYTRFFHVCEMHRITTACRPSNKLSNIVFVRTSEDACADRRQIECIALVAIHSHRAQTQHTSTWQAYFAIFFLFVFQLYTFCYGFGFVATDAIAFLVDFFNKNQSAQLISVDFDYGMASRIRHTPRAIQYDWMCHCLMSSLVQFRFSSFFLLLLRVLSFSSLQ